MKKGLRALGWTLGAIIAYGIVSWLSTSLHDRQWAAHEVSFPIPFPITDAEVSTLREERIAAGAVAEDPLAGVDLEAVALERAVARGERLVSTRLGCTACHGPDFAGWAYLRTLEPVEKGRR